MATASGVRNSLLGIVATTLVMMAGCSSPELSPSAERGRQVFQSQCTSCHNTDASKPGPVGPPIKGSSRQLLEAKVLHGTYPPGYTPKRSSTLMPPQPQVGPDIPALADYLK
jgi:mono/diheme cytochrome c family protein